jgi:hypothetical protein
MPTFITVSGQPLRGRVAEVSSSPSVIWQQLADADGDYTLPGICDTVTELTSLNPDWQLPPARDFKVTSAPRNITASGREPAK